MLSNYGVGEDSWESLGLQEDPTSQFQRNQSWIFIGRIDAEAETPILWPPDVKKWLLGKDPDAEKDWRREDKGTAGWDGWISSLTQWTWVWVNSKSRWWTGRPGLLQSMELQRVGHDLATEVKWTEYIHMESRKMLPMNLFAGHIFSSVQPLSHVQLSVTPWTAASQASLSITNSRNLLKHMSIESVMPSSHGKHYMWLIRRGAYL